MSHRVIDTVSGTDSSGKRAMGDSLQEPWCWFLESPGQDLVELELRCLEGMLSDIFGYYSLQVGLPGIFREIAALSRVRSQLLLRGRGGGVPGLLQSIADPCRWPVATDSIDLVILPHTLDFSPDPTQVLREADRVLIPEGRLIVFGFNPWGLFGRWHSLNGLRGSIPRLAQPISPLRIRDWLSVLGFDVEQQEPLMFRPPLAHRGLMQRLAFLDRAGRTLWPALAGAYGVRAVKRVSTLTPIRPSWSVRRRILVRRATEPTTRSARRV